MKKIIFLSVIVLFLLFTSCSKEKISIDFNGWGSGGGWGLPGGGIVAGNFFDNTALDFIYIPWNRYYIYKDSATGFTDSVSVTQNYKSSVFHDSVPGNPPVPKYMHETYKLTLQHMSGSPGQTWFNGFASCDTQYMNTAHFIDSDFDLTDTQNNLPAFWYPFTSSGANRYTLIPSITIEGTLFIQIHKFSSTNGLQPGDTNYRETTYYWEKGTGIIKREIRTYNSVKTSLLLRIGEK
ncbi:MAG: hypothetical protein ABIO79_10335 [Ferruginibacter sp.]